MSPFELHQCGKQKSEFTNIIKDNKSYLSNWTTLKFPVPPKQILIYVARNEKAEKTDYINMATKKKFNFARHIISSLKSKTVKPVNWNFQYRYTFLRNEVRKKSFEGKHKEQLRIAVDGTNHTAHSAANEISHRKLTSNPSEFQKIPRKDLSPNKHKLIGSVGRYVSASERARKMEESIILMLWWIWRRTSTCLHGERSSRGNQINIITTTE